MSGKTASRVREGKKTILAISLFVQCLCVVPLAMRHAERLICSGMCVGSSEPTIKWCGAVLPSPSTRTPTEIIAHLSGSTKSVENQNIKNMFSWKKFSNRETTDNRQRQMICAAFLWRHPFALNTHPYTIIWTKHSFIETQEQESACLQRSKTKPTSPTRLKGTFQHLCHFSNKIAGKPPLSQGRQTCLHLSTLQTQRCLISPAYALGHRPQLQRTRGNAMPFLSLLFGTKWRGWDAMRRLCIQIKQKEKKIVWAKAQQKIKAQL